MLASQALTTQALSGGRLHLGIGLSHQVVIEGRFGMSFDKPVRHMREYLSILMPLVDEKKVAYTGETLSANMTFASSDDPPCPVLPPPDRSSQRRNHPAMKWDATERPPPDDRAS
jgi:alkanesulfonate monooxygenase SsuD/methylene tetrahydromethanopterin reductase-like flavin-dependent oxidoreductase (luciferase family)